MARKKSEAPAALKVKVCSATRREGGRQVKCEGKYLGTDPRACPKSHDHLLPMPTGFCNNGWHEGSKSVDWKGNAVPTCKFYITCPCKCHDDIGKLFQLTDSERILVDASGYETPPSGFVMPDPIIHTVLSTLGDSTPPSVVESPAPDRVPARIDRAFTPTPTGRAARGELESWVRQHCDIWLIDEPGTPCTPAYLAEEIARDEGISPPSVGAITSVFNRWVDLGFAVIEKKPTRFVRYTEQGVKLGLEKMKADAKRKKHLTEAEKKRNLIR